MISKWVLFFLFSVIAGINWCVYGRPVYEDDIPMPEVHYDLPQAIVGEFTIIAFPDEYTITIYPNNKYIMFSKGYDTTGGFHYGYVIEKDNVYYFNPIGSTRQDIFNGLTEIYMSETGFSFYMQNHLYLKDFLFKAVPAPSKPEHIADTVTIPQTRTKQQYYIVDSHNRRVPLYAEGFFRPYEFSYSLTIDKGLVSLYDQMFNERVKEYFLSGIVWSGFLTTAWDDGENFSGKVQFTNSPAFYNIVDGDATIEKRGDSIIITAAATEYIEAELRKIYSIESSVYLVLEF
jgi:hypothetical protein